MEHLSWESVSAGAVAVALFLWKGVPYIKSAYEAVEKWRKTRTENDSKKIHESVEYKRVANETEDAEFARLKEMLGIYKLDNENLRIDLKNCQQSTSMSGVTINKLYRNINMHEQKLNHLDWLITREEKFQSLINPMAMLKESFEQLRSELP